MTLYFNIQYLLAGKTFLLLNFLSAGTPLVLQVSIKAQSDNISGPPLSPAGQEDLIGISREIADGKSAEEVFGT